jgi:hypothetical protein
VVSAVSTLYDTWRKEFRSQSQLPVSYQRHYFIGRGVLSMNSGIVQIKDFADEKGRSTLRAEYDHVQVELKNLRVTLRDMLLDSKALNYFADPQPTTIAKAKPARIPRKRANSSSSR